MIITDDAFEGVLLRPGDADWHTALYDRVVNGRRPMHCPDAILVASSVADVQQGVRLAAAQDWEVSVRSGGHSLPVWSVHDGGLLIDVGVLRAIAYDDDTHIVSCGPAVLGGAELAPFLAARGRSFPGGHCPSVGLGGFLLQGGQGWNQRGFGWAAEWLASVDVVTADGDLVRADAHHHSDLFWAARGAGPAFPGIVVCFHLHTRPAIGHVAETTQVYPLDAFDDVFAWLRGIHSSISPEVELSLLSTSGPDGEQERALVVNAIALVDDAATADIALALLADSPLLPRALHVEHARPSSLTEQHAVVEAMNPAGKQFISDSMWVEGDLTALTDALRPLFTTAPSPGVLVTWRSNAPMRNLPDMALSMQTADYVAVYMVYSDPGDYQLHRDWAVNRWADAAPVAVGCYIGDADPEHSELPYLAPKNQRRLREIIAARAPHGRFANPLSGS